MKRVSADFGSAVNAFAMVSATVLGLPGSAKRQRFIYSLAAVRMRAESANPTTTTNFAPGLPWSLLTNPPALTNGQLRILIDNSEAERYFRLRAP